MNEHIPNTDRFGGIETIKMHMLPRAKAQPTRSTEVIMITATKGVSLLTSNDVQTWYQPEGRRIFVGDVLDEKNSDTMGVGFARYAPGQSNEWVVTYDEALIVTKGRYTVTAEDGAKTTAKVGEIIYLTKGTKVVYSAEEETEVVYVAYPTWMDAQRRSQHAHLLDIYHPIEGGGVPDIRPR